MKNNNNLPAKTDNKKIVKIDMDQIKSKIQILVDKGEDLKKIIGIIVGMGVSLVQAIDLVNKYKNRK
ncbi:hypothetical protein [Brachyspira intermedia]|uniref:hypothetical protein n=1 Tax=Brachyspira intermedia TaxID=84377 RepID=UPI003004A2A5